MSANLNASTVSRRSGMLALAGVFAALVGVQGGCGSMGGGPRGPVTVPLEFRRGHAEPLSGSLPDDVKVHVAAVEDARDNKDEIGRNVEDATPIPVYPAADSTPAEFVRRQVHDELSDLGAKVVDSPDGADRVVSLELRRFFVEESNTFRAEVSCAAEVRDEGGQALWRQVVNGTGQTFGRSLKPENYQQTLSDATRRMIAQLVANPSFQKALAR